VARRFQWLVISSFLVAATLGIGACGNSNIPKIGIQVAPLCIEVAPGGTQQFNATIFVDQVSQGVDNSVVTWSVLGGDVNGTISNATGTQGLYTAPNTNPPPAVQVTIIATSNEDNQKQGQATAQLSGTCPAVPPVTQ